MHAALLLAVVMISLAVLYLVLEAPFLFAVQIIVYTGAILMLFLFVLMLVGVDASDSLVETIRGQRLLAARRRAGARAGARHRRRPDEPAARRSASRPPTRGGNIEGLANILFSRYVFAFEVTSALLITAAMGAMVLAHRERLTPKPTQASIAADKVRAYAERGQHLGPLPPPECSPATTRSTPRRCCPTARRPRSRSRGCSRPAASSASLRATSRTHQRAIDKLQDHEGRDDVTEYVVLSAILFTIGAVGVLTRRNAIVVFMCVELMLNACNLALVAFAKQHGNLDGQIAAFFVMVVAAAEVVVGLAIIMTIFRTRRSASVDDASLLKY